MLQLFQIPPLDADDLIRMLDSAGIQRAAVLSVAYLYGSPLRHFDDEYDRVRAENDWTAAQASRYPGRLVAFCSFNPLAPYAVAELERCAGRSRLARGIKLHFGNSDVDLTNPVHVAAVRRVFAAANAARMPIVVHLRANIANATAYGAPAARAFIDDVLAAAPDVDVQVAHLAGTGPGYDDPPADSAMAVLADAVTQRDPRVRRLWFDVAGIATTHMSAESAARMVARMRDVGMGRLLYGSDAATPGNLPPREAWAAFRRLPLTHAELSRIARNTAPYLGNK